MRFLLALCLSMLSLAVRAEFAVVVPQGSPIQTLSEQEVASIFLGKTNRFPNGDRALPLELNDQQLRQLFYQKVSGKSLIQLKSYWATLVFTGKGKPPRMVRDVAEVEWSLPNVPGAITYVHTDEVTDSMKVVYLVDGY